MREPIALLINDIHVSKDNIVEFNKNWDEMLSICQREQIEDVVVGGDMFTSRASQTLATLLAVKNKLALTAAQGIYTTIAEGNHDKVDPEAIDGYNHIWHGMKNVEIIDTFKAMCWDGCDFALLVLSYYPESGSFLDVLEKAVAHTVSEYSTVIKSKEDIILYIHEGVHGALGDFEIPNELPQEPLLGFKAVLCGHYHNRCRIKHTNIEYIGSSRQHNFGEDEEKGYTILYSDGTYEFVKNEVNTRYRTIEIDADSADGLQITPDSRYKNKIKVKCSEKQAKLFDKQKFLDLGFDKVEMIAASIVDKAVVAAGIQEKYDIIGIKKEYQEYCEENSIDSRLGIKYLEG